MRRIALCALLLAGCATAPGPSCVRLARDGWFCPLPPNALAPQTGTDLVTVTRKGRSGHYLGQLSVTPDRLTLALSSLAGVPLATVVWDGSEAQVRPPKAPFDPGLMTALLELTLAPPETLRGALHGLELSAAGGERRLTANGRPVAVARSDGGATRIEIPHGNVTVTLAPVAETGP